VELTVLGSGTGWIRLDRNSAGYLVKTQGLNLLLDCGPGVIKQFLKTGHSLEDIDAIFISHFHPDHVSDLIPLFFAMRYEMGYKRESPVDVFTSELFVEFFSHLKKAFNEWVEPPEGKVRFNLLPNKESEFQLGGLKGKTLPVKHNPESLAIRLEFEGKSLVYSGDTGYTENLIKLAEGADLLIVECSNPPGVRLEHHLSPEEVADIAAQAKVKRLLVSS